MKQTVYGITNHLVRAFPIDLFSSPVILRGFTHRMFLLIGAHVAIKRWWHHSNACVLKEREMAGVSVIQTRV